MRPRVPTLQSIRDAIERLGLRTVEGFSFQYIVEAPTELVAVDRWQEFMPRFRSRWRKLALQTHPDHNPGADPKKFIELQEAWEVVQNPAVPRFLHQAVRDATRPAIRVVAVTTGFTSTVSGGRTTDSTTTVYGGFSNQVFFVQRVTKG